jgi:hypothetical protein
MSGIAFGCDRIDAGLNPCALGAWAFSPKNGTTAPYFQMHPSIRFLLLSLEGTLGWGEARWQNLTLSLAVSVLA